MRAKLLSKGDGYGFGKKWSYRNCIIERYGVEDYNIFSPSKERIAFTSNLIHAKELVDYYIERNS